MTEETTGGNTVDSPTTDAVDQGEGTNQTDAGTDDSTDGQAQAAESQASYQPCHRDHFNC